MTDFYETWKGIAHKMKRSERWCRYMARRDQNPLPVFKIGGIVRLNNDDLEDWIAQQRARTQVTRKPTAEARERFQLIA